MAPAEHALMMPAMRVQMLFRFGLYTGRMPMQQRPLVHG